VQTGHNKATYTATSIEMWIVFFIRYGRTGRTVPDPEHFGQEGVPLGGTGAGPFAGSFQTGLMLSDGGCFLS
jgi:hypothetical protein